MLELTAIFLIVFGVISLLTSLSGASFLSSLIVFALLCLLGGRVQKSNTR